MQRLIETGWACGGALALKVILPARNRVISSVGWLTRIDTDYLAPMFLKSSEMG